MAGSSGTTPPKGTPRQGGQRRPVDAKTRARVRKLAREGNLSRNAIARECKISPSTVSLICAEAKPPITFDRTKTAAATEARTTDLKAKRAEISQRAVAEVERLFTLLAAPHEVIHWDTKTGWMSRDTIDRPTSGDVKNYATAIGILLDKHLVLVKTDSDDRDLPAVDQWLEAMMGRGA